MLEIMKKRIICILSLLLTGAHVFAQYPHLEWVYTAEALYYDGANDLSVDNQGNVLITGSFQGSIDFNPDTIGQEHISNGQYDIFVLKLNKDGVPLWSITIGGQYFDEGTAIVADQIGNVYVAGYFSDYMDCDPGPGIVYLGSNGFKDIFILKLDQFGNFIWGKNIGGIPDDKIIAIALDSTGNLLLTGSFGGTADFDPGLGTYNLVSQGQSDIFVAKLDTSASLIWAFGMGNMNEDYGQSLSVDPMGNVIVQGVFNLDVDFDPDISVYTLTSIGTYQFIAKYDSSGNFIWANGKRAIGNSMATDLNGNIFSTGYFYSTVDFDPDTGTQFLTSMGYQDIYVQKLDPGGNLEWVHQFGSTQSDEGFGLDCDSLGNVYICGQFHDTVDFDPGQNEEILIQPGNYSYQAGFIAKYTNNGDLCWAKDASPYLASNSLNVDNNNTIYIGNTFPLATDFFPGIAQFNLTPNGGLDMFVLKLIQVNHPVALIGIESTHIPLGDTARLYDYSSGLPTQWHWDFGDGNSDTVQNTTHKYQNPGIYDITLVASDSVQSDTLTIEGYIMVYLPLNISYTIANVSCNTGSDGAIDIHIGGGTPPFAFLWSNGSTQEDAINLPAGTYSVEVWDNAYGYFTQDFEITEPHGLYLPAYVYNLKCNGIPTGSINTNLQQGTSPYSYLWSNGSTEEDLTNLFPGVYSLTVTDANNCVDSTSFEIFQPPPIMVWVKVTNCNSIGLNTGAIEIKLVTGGTPQYTFLWNNGSVDTSLYNIGAGAYSLTITDHRGCLWDSVFVVAYPYEIDMQEGILNTIKIYPNPIHDKLYIDLGNKSECDFESRPDSKIELLNACGQVVLEKEIGNRTKLELVLRHLPAGQYFVRIIEDEQEVFVEKILKE